MKTAIRTLFISQCKNSLFKVLKRSDNIFHLLNLFQDHVGTLFYTLFSNGDVNCILHSFYYVCVLDLIYALLFQFYPHYSCQFL